VISESERRKGRKGRPKGETSKKREG